MSMPREVIRYLSKEEAPLSRPLWQEAFLEDSEEFDDYYYDSVMQRNRVLVKEVDGEIVSMAHRNPYQMVVKDQLWNTDYVVGVATAASKRRCGHMGDVLRRMLRDMRDERMPFCYLMPAAERIYLPYGFTYIFDQPQWKLANKVPAELRRVDLKSEDTCREIGEWQMQWLASRYEVYCRRDGEYISWLAKELASEDGFMEAIFRDGRMSGLRCEWGFGQREQRALLCDESLLNTVAEPKPAIMARIVDVSRFVEVIGLWDNFKEEVLEVEIYLVDEILEENTGRYRWTLCRETSHLEKVDDSTKPFDELQTKASLLTLQISQLTSWLFGYRPLTELVEKDTMIPEWCSCVRVLKGVYLDEVV